MTTVRALHEDALYAILPHCSASIDMWNFLLALDFSPEQISNLRAFWSQTRLTSPNVNEEKLLAFVREVAMFSVELRLDHLNWLSAANLRRLLMFFRTVVVFHTGNVALSKRTLIHDLPNLFHFLHSVHLLVSLVNRPDSTDEQFQEICSTLASMKQLKSISLLLEEEKNVCLPDRSAQIYLRSIADFLAQVSPSVRLISIEENFFNFHQRFHGIDSRRTRFFGELPLELPSDLQHLLVHFRPSLNFKFNLKVRPSAEVKLQTLVLPNSSFVLDKKVSLERLKLLHLGYYDPSKASPDWFRPSLRNLTLQLNERTAVELLVEPVVLRFSSTFHLEIPAPFFRQLTNLNFTGLHCHSAALQTLLDDLSTLRSLSLSPCSFFLDDGSSLRPKRTLLALNLVCDEKNPRDVCPISRFSFEQMLKTSIRTSWQQLDLHHFSVRCPNYQIQRDDFVLSTENHLETLVLDVRVPVSFHAILTEQFALKRLENLRRFCLFTSDEFQLTEMLFDRFVSLETLEIISPQSNLRRSTIKYVERVLHPSTYRNLNEFSFQFGRVDAQHLVKQLNKTVRSRFVAVRPGFRFHVASECKSILYDRKHPLHRFFHAGSTQISLIFPPFLNYLPLYDEMNIFTE